MLHPGVNKAKAQLTADPRRNPKNKAAANNYMQKVPIQHKASVTMKKIESVAKKHKVKNTVSYSSSVDSFETLILTLFQFVAKVKANVKKNFPNVRRSELDKDYFE